MKSYWTQPSLSRDFALLSAAIIFLLFLISTWVTYATYNSYSDRIAIDMEKESQRIERRFNSEMENANYMLTALGRQIVIDSDRNLIKLAQVLKSFDAKGHIYAAFSWIDAEQRVVVSSRRGVLEKPIDVSERDYIKQAAAEPWKMQIGRPAQDDTPEHHIIPLAMGLTDYTGKFVGIIVIHIDTAILTDHLSTQIHQNGIDFAIVSKTLAPVIQASNDKDFVTQTFPVQKIGSLNFSERPNGAIAQGNPFFGTGSYFYYRALGDYPYVILLGYDVRYTDDVVRGMLWSRLLQLFIIAIFFVLFLWIMRARMIRPVLDITAAAAAVANGQPQEMESVQGPEEIRALSAQIGRIGEYIKENKRIEDELRNKMFMLKKAKEASEASSRSKSEFLAYVCQEIRTVLNHIIGFAQTMRDQLHGPIENRKYRGYAADIYSISNTLLGYTQDLLTFAKTDTGYITLMERPIDVPEMVDKTLRFIADKMQSEKRNIKVKLQEPLPKLIVDEFRLQQILTNLLLYMFHYSAPDQPLSLEVKLVSENKEKLFFAILAGNGGGDFSNAAVLSAWAERLFGALEPIAQTQDDLLKNQADLSFELVKSLVALHQGQVGIKQEIGGLLTVAIFFPMPRIHLSENARG